MGIAPYTSQSAYTCNKNNNNECDTYKYPLQKHKYKASIQYTNEGMIESISAYIKAIEIMITTYNDNISAVFNIILDDTNSTRYPLSNNIGIFVMSNTKETTHMTGFQFLDSILTGQAASTGQAAYNCGKNSKNVCDIFTYPLLNKYKASIPYAEGLKTETISAYIKAIEIMIMTGSDNISAVFNIISDDTKSTPYQLSNNINIFVMTNTKETTQMTGFQFLDSILSEIVITYPVKSIEGFTNTQPDIMADLSKLGTDVESCLPSTNNMLLILVILLVGGYLMGFRVRKE